MDILFDPQTAGGFLASVPAGSCEAVLAALDLAGFASTRIGTIIAGDPRITVR